MKTLLKWNASKEESEIIQKIAERASRRLNIQLIEALMDIEACHCNAMPLDLRRLSNADDFNFAHDVLGIHRHLDRNTGELRDCFVPRFAVR